MLETIAGKIYKQIDETPTENPFQVHCSHLHNLAENHLIDNAIQIFKNPSNLVKIDSFFKNNREKMEFDKMLPLFKAAYFVEKKI